MKILITGATGFIGARLCQILDEAGHTLTILSRDIESAKQELPQIEGAFAWDASEGPPPVEAFEGIEAVVHLAGETVSGRWTPERKRAIRETRVRGTRHLIQAITSLDEKPLMLVSASAIGLYGHRGGEDVTEESPPGSGFLAEICQSWEREARRAEEFGVSVACLRFGLVLGPGGGALQAMLIPFKLGLGGPMGSGQQWWSWVHRDDVVGMIQYALEHELSGPFNVTSPQPVRQKDVARTLGRVLRRPAFLPAPAFALRLALGEFANELLISQRVLPKRAQETGYEFQYPRLEPALRAILS